MIETSAAISETSTAVASCVPLAAPALSNEEAEATAELFAALGDPHRVKIVNLLVTSHAPVCVCNLTGPLGLAQPTVSHHLKRLMEVGLLEREQRGKLAFFSLNQEAVSKLAGLIDLEGVSR